MRTRTTPEPKGGEAGFTLVELVIVIAIIGVLAAIAVPIYLNQAQAAREKADLATVSEARTAVVLYIQEGNELTPDANGVIDTAPLVPYGFPASSHVWVTSTNTAAGDYAVGIDYHDTQSGRQCQAGSQEPLHCFG